MLELQTPRGLVVRVPESDEEDPSPRFDVADSGGLRAYYEANGYVVARSAVSRQACEGIRRLWDSEVKPSRAFMYRQATARAERHVLNANGWVMNPILNLQSVDPRLYPSFRDHARERILTAPGLVAGFRALLGETPKVVQSMYFEGNSATWEHQDSYYLDSERVGTMAGAWIALEDIDARAGRFFISPRSHFIDLGRQTSAINIADRHDEYIGSVVAKIRELGLEIRAPFLRQGDVLYWNSWTIHGSLDSRSEQRTRSSITCHAIAQSHRFLQLQSRVLPLRLSEVNGIQVHQPKDLARPFNRAVMKLESRFPAIFYGAKKLAVKTLVRMRNG
jgi:phytanoyl-CoA hydroxylase